MRYIVKGTIRCNGSFEVETEANTPEEAIEEVKKIRLRDFDYVNTEVNNLDPYKWADKYQIDGIKVGYK